MAILFNKAECSILATALNNAKRASFTPSQQAQLPKLCRRLAGFLIDGQTVKDCQTSPKKKKLIGFAKIRAEDWQRLEVEPPVAIDVPAKLPPLAVSDCEAIYATLRGEPKLTS